MNLNSLIFRAYDIRGIYPIDLNKDNTYLIGKSFGSYIQKLGYSKVLVGYDNRLSSPLLNEYLIKGIISTGTDVISLGLVTTPMFYYARYILNICSGIMITASHNPSEYNGFKISFTDKGNALGEEIKDFYNFTLQDDFIKGQGIVTNYNIKKEYLNLFKTSLELKKKIKVVVDLGNGTTSIIVQDILDSLFLEYELLYANSDPTFPNHHPDPSISSNLVALQQKVVELKYDLGIALDADGDRVGIVDNLGNIISSDYYMIIIYNYLKDKIKNKVAYYDVKCSKSLSDALLKLNYMQVMTKTGNSYLYRYVHEKKLKFAGEYSGHMFFNDKFPGFDDGLYAGLRLVEILSSTNKLLSELISDLNINYYYSTEEIKIPVVEEIKFLVMDKIEEYFKINNYNFKTIDGVRVETSNYWFLVRASNTTPNLTLRFEALNKDLLKKIKDKYLNIINNIIAEFNISE